MNDTRPISRHLAYVIEDDLRLCDIFSEALKMAGFVVEAANSGQDAISNLKLKRPHLILLDLHLPKISGDVVLTEIKQMEHLNNSVVILTTADAQKANSLREFADFVLLKPISFSQLHDLATRLHPDKQV